MANAIVKKMKPTSPGRRGMVKVSYPDQHKGAPYAPLVVPKKKSTGRSHGTISSRHRGGGHKQNYRLVDFRRLKDSIPGIVERIEYDPNRTSSIALILYPDGERRYILAPDQLSVGDKVVSGESAPIAVGNCLPLRNIPDGSTIHNVELKPGKGGQLARSAGTSIYLMAKESNLAKIRLKSGEVRTVSLDCRATMGEVSNSKHNLRKLGKAGANRWRNKRPQSRGVAMNPVDHPLGGGEGKTSGGRHPCSPWGLLDGKKTRKNKFTNVFIIRRRKRRTDKQGRK